MCIRDSSTILQDVKTRKDEAVKDYTQRFDGIVMDELRVAREEVETAAARADTFFVESMKKAKENIAY